MDAAHHAVDIASLAQQLRVELAAADSPAAGLADGCPIVIAEVGALTRNVDPPEYEPHHVSIGPYHRIKNPHLVRDDDKVQCLGSVLAAASTGVKLEDFLDVVARLEAQARSCYAHMFCLESTEFVRMLLLDACYVLVRFGGVGAPRANGHAQGGHHRHSGAPATSVGGDMMEDVAVVRDAIYLAENQIPFFVVEEIHRLTVPDRGVSAADAIAGYVRELLQGQQYSVATLAVTEPGNLLHLLHMHLTPTVLSPRPTGKSRRFGRWRSATVPTVFSPCTTGNNEVAGKRGFDRWRSATEYYCAGVGFRSRALGGKEALSILDVKLHGRSGTLEIPRIKIDAETPRLLRNLMALEQRNPAAAGSHVTAYCVFLSQLASTPRDVELLSKRGVIAHGLGSHDEAATCLADLCKGVAFRPDDPVANYLRATWQGLEERFGSRPRRWAAWLMLTYFSNPWLAVGLAAAAVGLVCTVVQAVYSVLSYGGQ